MRASGVVAPLAALAVLTACAGDPERAPSPAPNPPPMSGAVTTRPIPTPSPAPPPEFDAAAAVRTVRDLAGEIGPREATSAAYRRAASSVADQLRALGYTVTTPEFRVPAGNSWGVDVPAGVTHNVVATPRNLAPGARHVVVGAHLDTVPQAPGAEDNASGVAVLLEIARMAAAAPAELRVPVVLVAFGAEEPRGSGDDRHHYGSRDYVENLTATQRGTVVGMVSLDRVGVGSVVPVCNGGSGTQVVVRQLRAAARAADVPTRNCTANRSSDHWSFEKAGLPAARLGSTPYAGYHSERDRPSVVSRAQLDRVGRLTWAWLTAD